MNCAWDETSDNTVPWPIAFASNGLLHVKRGCSNIEREALGIHNRLQISITTALKEKWISCETTNFHYYNQKKKKVILSKWPQCMLLRINQYKIGIQYRLGQGLCITEWLLRQNYVDNKDEEMAGKKLSTDAVSTMKDILSCVSIQHINKATQMMYIYKTESSTSLLAGHPTEVNLRKTLHQNGCLEMNW